MAENPWKPAEPLGTDENRLEHLKSMLSRVEGKVLPEDREPPPLSLRPDAALSRQDILAKIEALNQLGVNFVDTNTLEGMLAPLMAGEPDRPRVRSSSGHALSAKDILSMPVITDLDNLIQSQKNRHM